MGEGGGIPRPALLTGAKNSHLGCLISFELPMGFQNFVEINKIHPLKKGCSMAESGTPPLVNSSSPQISELVEDAVAYRCGDTVWHFWLIRNDHKKLVGLKF